MRGSSGSYSVDRVVEFLTPLCQDVEVVIKPTRKRHRDRRGVVRRCVTGWPAIASISFELSVIPSS